MELIYRGTRDGTTSRAFHKKCDNQGPTVCLYKNENNYIFGGFTSLSWTSPENSIYQSDPYSFIFTLTNIHNTSPKKLPNSSTMSNMRHNINNGPTFGGKIAEFAIYEDFLIQSSYSNFPQKYKDLLGKGKSIFTSDPNNNSLYFKIKEIEVFKCLN